LTAPSRGGDRIATSQPADGPSLDGDGISSNGHHAI
jgi:hypothetical protein